jgi:hypothetical protein
VATVVVQGRENGARWSYCWVDFRSVSRRKELFPLLVRLGPPPSTWRGQRSGGWCAVSLRELRKWACVSLVWWRENNG